MTWPQSCCPQCKTEYSGWAFGNPGCHICSKCGAKLVIKEAIDTTETDLYGSEEDTSNLETVFPER
jgi:hypothetical protein